MVQVFRKRKKSGLSSSNRSSLPCLLIRRNRKLPSRAAQSTTMAANSMPRASTPGDASTRNTVMEM